MSWVPKMWKSRCTTVSWTTHLSSSTVTVTDCLLSSFLCSLFVLLHRGLHRASWWFLLLVHAHLFGLLHRTSWCPTSLLGCAHLIGRDFHWLSSNCVVHVVVQLCLTCLKLCPQLLVYSTNLSTNSQLMCWNCVVHVVELYIHIPRTTRVVYKLLTSRNCGSISPLEGRV